MFSCSEGINFDTRCRGATSHTTTVQNRRTARSTPGTVVLKLLVEGVICAFVVLFLLFCHARDWFALTAVIVVVVVVVVEKSVEADHT